MLKSRERNNDPSRIQFSQGSPLTITFWNLLVNRSLIYLPYALLELHHMVQCKVKHLTKMYYIYVFACIKKFYSHIIYHIEYHFSTVFPGPRSCSNIAILAGFWNFPCSPRLVKKLTSCVQRSQLIWDSWLQVIWVCWFENASSL